MSVFAARAFAYDAVMDDMYYRPKPSAKKVRPRTPTTKMEKEDLKDTLVFLRSKTMKESFLSYSKYVLLPKVCYRKGLREKLITHGNSKMDNSLDVLSQIRSLSKLRLIEKTLFTK